MDSTMQSPQAPEMGTFARLINVLFSPSSTFESIARKPAFLVPVVVILAWTLLAGVLVSPRLDTEAIVEKQVKAAEKRSGADLPADQVEGMRKGIEGFVKLSPIIGLVFVTVVLFMVPGIYHGIVAAWGKATSYKAVVSMYAHAWMVQVVKGILLVAVAMTREKIDPEAMGTLLKSNIGAFLDPATSNAALRTILTNVDVFDLWGLVLCVIGLSKVTKLNKNQAAFVVFGVWAVYVLVSAGFAALGASFGG